MAKSLVALIIIALHATVCAQNSEQTLRKSLSERAAFNAEEFAALERGEAIVKLLPATDRREVSVCGVIKLPAAPEVSLTAFQLSLSQLQQKSVLGLGKFSNPPRIEDLNGMTLSRRDITDLKNCGVHDCKLNLSAKMIERFQKSVDWGAPDHETQANQLFRQMILDYVAEYLQQGDAALIEYANERVPVSLRRQQESLMTKLIYANDVSPEFINYLKEFPKSSSPNVEHHLSWAKLSFGLKPVIIITDVLTYRSGTGDTSRILSLSKQIYAHHYFDASLVLTAVTGATSESRPHSYLLYANYSRASGLATSFSNFKHNVVESEATDNLRDLLQQTRTNVDAALSTPSASPPQSRYRIVGWFKGLPIVVRWFLFAMAVALVFYAIIRFIKSVSRRKTHESGPP